MKRSIALTIALAVSVISLSLLSSDSTARAQKQMFGGCSGNTTGVVTLGANQILRITVVNRGKADSKVRFGRMEYSQGTCNGSVCKHSLIEEVGMPVVTLAPGEAASVDIANTSFGVGGTAYLDYFEDFVVAQIIDGTTGAVVSSVYTDYCVPAH